MTPVPRGSHRKQVAIMSGGDWYDASCDHVSVPADLDLEAAEREYDEWIKTSQSYITFIDWLEKFKGATESTVEEYWRD